MRKIVYILFLIPLIIALSQIEVESYYNRALDYIKQNDYDQAYDILKQIEEIKPGYRDLYYNLGLCAEKLGYSEEAYKYFALGLEQLKETGLPADETFQFRGYDYIEAETETHIDSGALLRLAKVYIQQGEYDLAEKYAKRVLNFSTKDAEVYFVIGLSQFYQNKNDDALRNFKQCLFYNKRYAQAYYYAGKIRQQRGQLNLAEANFRLAIKYASDFYEPYFSLAQLYESTARDTESVKIYEKILEKDSDNIDALINLGRLRLKQGRYYEGFELLTRAKRNLGNEKLIDELLIKYSGDIAQCLYEQKKYDMSLYYYQLAFKNTRKPLYLVRAAKIYLMKGKPQQALSTLQPIIETADDLELYEVLGEIYTKLNKTSQAILAYETYLKKKAKLDIQFKLARLYKSAGMGKRYEELLKKILKKYRKNARALCLLADYYYEKRDLGKAKDIYLKLKNVTTVGDTVYYRLAKIFKEQGNTSIALRYINQAIKLNPRPEYYFLQFKIYFKQNDFILAQKSLKKLLEISPDYFPALYNMGIIHFKLHNYTDALQYFLNAQKTGFAEDIARYIGLCYFHLHDYENALAYLEKVDTQGLEDKIFISYFNIANERFKNKEYFEDTGAITYYNKALKYLNDKRNRARIFFQMGLIYAYNSQDDSAFIYFQKSFKSDSDFYAPFFNIGVLYESKQMYDSAIIFYRKVLIYEPTNIRAITNIANCYAKLENYPEAIKWYERAYAIMPDNKVIIENLTSAYLLNKDYANAQRLLDKLPHTAHAVILSAEVYAGMGEIRSAEDILLKGINEFDYDTLYLKLADLYVTNNEIETAIVMLENRLTQHYSKALLLKTLQILLKQNRNAEAESLIDKLAKKYGNNIDLYITTAVSFYENKDYDRAEKYAKLGTKIQKSTELEKLLSVLERLKQ